MPSSVRLPPTSTEMSTAASRTCATEPTPQRQRPRARPLGRRSLSPSRWPSPPWRPSRRRLRGRTEWEPPIADQVPNSEHCSLRPLVSAVRFTLRTECERLVDRGLNPAICMGRIVRHRPESQSARANAPCPAGEPPVGSARPLKSRTRSDRGRFRAWGLPARP